MNDTITNLDQVKELLKEEIECNRQSLIEDACNFDPMLEDVCNAEIKDLPLFVAVSSESAKKVLAARLKGEEPDMEPFLNVLSDTEFDDEGYHSIGHRDGQLFTLNLLAKKLGLNDLADKAYEAIYSI